MLKQYEKDSAIVLVEVGSDAERLALANGYICAEDNPEALALKKAAEAAEAERLELERKAAEEAAAKAALEAAEAAAAGGQQAPPPPPPPAADLTDPSTWTIWHQGMGKYVFKDAEDNTVEGHGPFVKTDTTSGKEVAQAALTVLIEAKAAA